MRANARQEREHTIARVNGYHHGDYEKHLIFVSDRPSETDEYYTNYITGEIIEKALFGIEWETQNWGITDSTIYANVLRDIVFQPFHKDLWKIERDGSLMGGCDSSAECITQPMTKAYIRNHYRDFKYMWEKANAFGIDCERTGDCGMHVHISNIAFGRKKETQTDAIRKFLYIINKHYDIMRYSVNRTHPTGYCPQMRYFTNVDNCKNINFNDMDNDHYVCVNMGHYSEGNIELRLVGGQKDFPCFRNTMEVIFHIVEIVKTISWSNCDDITKVFKGCNQYVLNRIKSHVFGNGLISEEQLNTIRDSVVRENLL